MRNTFRMPGLYTAMSDTDNYGQTPSHPRPVSSGSPAAPAQTRRLPIPVAPHSSEGHHASEAGQFHIPRPRRPLADSLRRVLPRPEQPDAIDIRMACRGLVEVAVRTTAYGSWQEHAHFVLNDADGECTLVPFSHPAVSDLLPRLRALPGFDDDLLLDVIGSSEARLVVLWRDPELARTIRH
jgi:hypothetical protein